MTDKLNQFVGQRYMCLETYRRNGSPVRTPVWFVEHNGQLMFYTMAASGKAKRLRRELGGGGASHLAMLAAMSRVHGSKVVHDCWKARNSRAVCDAQSEVRLATPTD